MVTALPAFAEQTRWHEYTAKFRTPKNPVEVKLASFLGGSGTEWLTGAGFQPDGTLVLVGTALGPELTIAGKPVQVLGPDGKVPVGEGALDWSRSDGAPFAVWLKAGEVKRVV